MVDESFSMDDSVMAMLPNLSALTLVGAETMVPVEDVQGNHMMEDLYVQPLPGRPWVDTAVGMCKISVCPIETR